MSEQFNPNSQESRENLRSQVPNHRVSPTPVLNADLNHGYEIDDLQWLEETIALPQARQFKSME